MKCFVFKPGLKIVDWKPWSFGGGKAIVWEQTFLSVTDFAACSKSLAVFVDRIWVDLAEHNSRDQPWHQSLKEEQKKKSEKANTLPFSLQSSQLQWLLNKKWFFKVLMYKLIIIYSLKL